MNNFPLFALPFLFLADLHGSFSDYLSAHITEQHANSITLSALFFLWITLFILSLKRTVKWEVVSTSLTIALFLQSLRELVSVLAFEEIYIASNPIRWFLRISLVVVSMTAIVATMRDKPVPVEFLRRRWTDKFTDDNGIFDNNRLWVETGESLRHMNKALEEVAGTLEELSLGPVSRDEYIAVASKIRRHVHRAQRMLQPPVPSDLPLELQGIMGLPENLPSSKK
jgi:hypothetical protein